MELLPWQADVASQLAMGGFRSGKTFTIKSKRQVGKSQLIEQALLYFACPASGCTVSMAVSPTLIQARKLYKELTNADRFGAITSKNSQLLEVEFRNGSQILFKSAEQGENLRSFTVSGILCIDEAAYIKDDVFDILAPVTDVYNAPRLICSTPRFRQGNFYKYYQFGTTRRAGYLSYDWSKYDTSALLPPERLEEYRQTLPSTKFTTEYLGEFLDSDSILFKDFRKTIKEGREDYRRIYLGIDWGSGTGQDNTALSALNERCEQVYATAFSNLSTTETIAFIVKLVKEWKKAEDGKPGKVVEILAEKNSIGKPYIDLLIAEGIPVRPWVTTNASKSELVSALRVAFEQERITLLQDEDQAQEVSMYESEYHPSTGLVSFNAPDGFHDDRVIALMLSLRCFNDNNARNNYSIHIH